MANARLPKRFTSLWAELIATWAKVRKALFGGFPQPPVRATSLPYNVQRQLIDWHDLIQALIITVVLLELVWLQAKAQTTLALLVYWSIVLLHRWLAQSEASSNPFNYPFSHFVRAVLVAVGNIVFIIWIYHTSGYPPEGAPDLLWLLFAFSMLSVSKTGNWRYLLTIAVFSIVSVLLLDWYRSTSGGSPYLWFTSAVAKAVWLVAFALVHFFALNFLNDTRRDFKLIQTIIHNMAQAQSLINSLNEATRAVAEHFGFEYVNIFFREGNDLTLAWSNVPSGQRHLRYRLSIGSYSLNSKAAAIGETVIEPDVTQAKDYWEVDFFPHTIGEMVVPLKVGGEIVGTLDIQITRPGGFLTHQITLMQDTFGPGLAAIIFNRRQAERVVQHPLCHNE